MDLCHDGIGREARVSLATCTAVSRGVVVFAGRKWRIGCVERAEFAERNGLVGGRVPVDSFCNQHASAGKGMHTTETQTSM